MPIPLAAERGNSGILFAVDILTLSKGEQPCFVSY